MNWVECIICRILHYVTKSVQYGVFNYTFFFYCPCRHLVPSLVCTKNRTFIIKVRHSTKFVIYYKRICSFRSTHTTCQLVTKLEELPKKVLLFVHRNIQTSPLLERKLITTKQSRYNSLQIFYGVSLSMF